MADAGTQGELRVVLLIDDDLVSREVTATVLTMGGYTVHTAENGEASLNLLGSGVCVPEVILMDAQMPGLSGVKLIAALRARSHANLYAVSGSDPADEILAAVDGFLLKPFDSEALGKLVEERSGGQAIAQAPSIDSNEPVISVEVLAQLRRMMPEKAVRQIFTAMMADLATRIEALDVAIGKGDLAEVRRIGHAIKGGCGMAGAVQAATLGARLEMVSAESPSTGSEYNAALLRDLRAAERGLKSMLNSELPA